MKTFTQVVRLSFIALLCFVGLVGRGQSVINPADTIVTYKTGTTAPATPPLDGKPYKWLRTVRLSWNTSEWKCYILNGTPFRVHFPKSYTTAADGKIYPLMVFFHGLGEAGPVTDNEISLYHGGDVFQKGIDNGTFDGFVVVPQTQGGWGPYPTVRAIIDYMIANNKVDRFHVTENGLSAGAQGVWQFFSTYPTYICYINPMSGVFQQYTDPNFVNGVKYTPIWHLHGGLDGDPTPQTSAAVLAAMQAGGANYTDKNYVTLGHDTWDSTWQEPDFWPAHNRAYMSNPWPLFGRTKFCPGDNINVTIGVMAGMDGYQWRFNGTALAATTNSIVATQAGVYDCRVMRAGLWSDWSHTPVTIVIQTPTITPPIQVNGLQTSVLPGADGKTSVDLTVPNASTYTTFNWQQVGSSTVLSTSPVYTATQPGSYKVSVNTQFGCSSVFSPAFAVVNANGSNGPSAVGNLVANSNSNTKVNLAWSLSPNQTNPATTLEVYRGTKAGGPYKLAALLSPSAVSYTDSLLNPNVKYFYTIRAVNGNAASSLANEANATTLNDNVPPTAPGALTITGSSRTAIALSWTPSTDNVGVTQYDIYINGVKNYVTTQTSFIANGLTHSQTYSFTVKAEDGSGNVSTASNQVIGQAIVSGLNYSYYNVPSSMSTLPDLTTMTPAASGISPNTDITLYQAQTTVNFAYLWQGYITIPVNGTYKFQTTSDDGSKLWFNSYTPTGTATVNNDGLHGGTTVTSSALTLTAGTYPICIEFFQIGGGSSMSVSWISQQAFGNTTAVNIANSYFRETVALGGTAPARPTAVKALAQAYNAIKLTWTDNSTNETGFEVYRAATYAGPYSIVATAAAGATSYTDSSLTAATTYFYRVQSINNYGSSGFDSVSTGGLVYKYYQGAWNNTPNFDTLTPVSTGILPNVSLSPAIATTNYGFKFSGTLTVPVTGQYTLYTTSDDGSKLYIGGYDAAHLLVNNDFLQGSTQRGATINLTKGTAYPYYVSYFQQGGGAALSVQWKGPGIAVANVPDSAFANPNCSATTLGLPAAPAVPTSFTGTSTSSAVIQLGWQDASPNLTGFGLYRSFGDSTHFQLLATLPVATSYKDSALFGHSTYYYKVQALGAGGNSAFTPALLVTTLDNAPVVTNNAIKTLRYGTSATVIFTATDPDGDVMSYSGVNLPGFATLHDNGNGTATLTLNPAVSDAGNYSGIGVKVSDGSGGLTNSVFNLSVNNNFAPVISNVPDYTAYTATTLSIPLSATDANTGDPLTFKVSGLPSNYSLVTGPNGSDTLKITPNPGAKGLYTVIATVTDSSLAASTDTFHVNVIYKDPSSHIYIRPGAGDAIGAPWNTMTGVVDSNLVDANGNTTSVALTFTPWWWFPTYSGGQSTGNNSGVYPDAVLKDYMWWGISGGPDTANATISGLDPTKTYSIDLSGSATGANYGGTVIYYVNNQPQTLVVQNNTSGIVTFSNVKPNPDGTVAVKMAKGTGVQSGYWNAMVISSSFDDGTAPLAPSNLTAQNLSGHGVQLNWIDSAYNETGYQVLRATSAAGPFTLVKSIAVPNTISYLDSPVNGNVKYYYTVNAINAHGTSRNTDTASLTTADRIPVINAIGNVALKGGQSQQLTITAVDDSTDHLSLSVSGLPAYASFTDNGNGTATMNINPPAGVVDLSTVTVTVTDASDSSSSASFGISVVDKDVNSVYLAFTGGPIAPAPFNTVQAGGTTAAGFSFTNFTDDSNNPTSISLTLLNGFTYAVQYGMRSGNGNGLYPDMVLRNNFFEFGAQKDSVKISGLNPNKMYNLVFFASHDDNIPSVTNFSVGSKVLTLDASYNTNKTVNFNGLRSDANGNIVFGVQKATGGYWCFLNALVIQSYDTSVSILAPSDLRVIDKKTSSVTLQWQDRAYNETGFELWRSVGGGSYSLLKTLAAGTVTYKDSALNPNSTYFYIVRAIKGAVKSAYTQAVSATTYAYAIDINVGDDNLALAPWNNLATPPSPGVTWSNFFKDESGIQTSLKLVLNGNYAGGQPEGNVTGNNSGIYPDAVLQKEYITFPGQIGGFLFSNLDVSMKYDITFMPSVYIWADNTTFFAVGNDTVIMSATLNSNHTVTMLGVSPDSKGNIQIWMGLYGGSEQGTVNAIVMNGYNPSTISTPASPVSTATSNKVVTNSSNAFVTPPQLNGDSVVMAFPNPFISSFTLSVPAQQNDKVTVMIYDISGSPVYQKEFANLNQGTNYLKIEPQWATKAGVYLVRMISSNGLSKYKVIKVVKM